MLEHRYIKTFTMIIAAVMTLVANGALAIEYKLGAIRIEDPWIRATPNGAEVAAGYLSIRNTGTTPDRLVGGSADIASRFEMHEMKMDGDVAKMRQLKGIDIKPGETIEFKPGASHVMFVGLNRQLERGENVKGTLFFERAGSIEIEYAVEPLGAQSRSHRSEDMH
jgi:copper(I)-binding protein